MLLSAIDFPTIQAVLDAAEDGDRIYLPAGKYYVPIGTSWKITKSLEIFGDGPGRSGYQTKGTYLSRADSGGSLPMFEITPAPGASEVGQVYIHDLKLDCPRPAVSPAPSPAPSAIRCTVASGSRIRRLRLDRVLVEQNSPSQDPPPTAEGFGLNFEASPGTLENLSLRSCYIKGITGLGVSLKNIGMTHISRGGGGGCTSGWLKAEASAVALFVIECERDGAGATATQGPMLLLSCSIAHVEACRFESFYVATVPTALEFKNCGGAALASCNSFVKTAPVKSTTGIKVSAVAAGDNCPVTILSNNFIRIYGDGVSPGAMVDVSGSHHGCVVLPQFDDGPSLTPIPGQIKLPGSPNGGLFSVPTIASRGLPFPNNGLAGMIIPSGPILPTTSVQNGMLFFLKFVDEEENLYIRISNAWRRAVTG